MHRLYWMAVAALVSLSIIGCGTRGRNVPPPSPADAAATQPLEDEPEAAASSAATSLKLE